MRQDDDEFPGVADVVRMNYAIATAPFYRTDSEGLYQTYLQGFTGANRQHHNCHECRRFIERYGDLVTLDENGNATSVFWSNLENAPQVYRRSISLLRQAVEKRAVTSVFHSEDKLWGSKPTRDGKRKISWSHFEVKNRNVFTNPLKTASQAMAESIEEFGMVGRGIAEFSRDTVVRAKALLDSEQLYRGEKTLGVATWLLGIHDAIERNKRRSSIIRRNILWHAVGSAPPGFCHIKSTMIGTLLEDLESNMDFGTVKRRFAEKMHPLQYQRPTAPPSTGNIIEAERIVAKLRSAGALDRRFARLEDIEAIWKPTQHVARPRPGVFSHLLAREPELIEAGTAPVMTWEKFARMVLPTAENIEFHVPAHGNFIALVTAANPEAPPMLQWDSEDYRNPVSWYVYNGGRRAMDFNLSTGWVKVNAVTLLPSMWNGGNKHHGEGVILILDGARDRVHTKSGGYFVETLKNEYHPIRRTLEAHMMQATVAGKELATACGYDLRKGQTWNVDVRVTANGVRTRYRLDRWD